MPNVEDRLLAHSESQCTCVQAAYLSRKLQAARGDFAAAAEARQKLAQRDREVSATMADMHRDMAGHVVRSFALQYLDSTSTLVPRMISETMALMHCNKPRHTALHSHLCHRP